MSNNTSKTIEQQRIEKLKEVKAKTGSQISYHVKNTSNPNVTTIQPKVGNMSLTNAQQKKLVQANLLTATGTASEEFERLLLSQTISAFSKSSGDFIYNT